MARKPITEMATDTRILYNRLEQMVKADKKEISYEELSASIGRSVQTEAQGLLRTARKNIERDYQLIIEPVIGEGLKISDDYAGVLEKQSAHIRRQAGKHCKRVLNAIADKELKDGQVTRVAERLSMLGAVRLFTVRKPPKRLTEYIEMKKAKELPTAETIKLFS